MKNIDLANFKYCDHPKLNKLFQDVSGMPIAKIHSLTEAVLGAELFLNDSGFESFKGKMLVAAKPKLFQADKRTANRLMLGMNVMRWLTKFYLPEITKGFGKIYRLHSTTARGAVVGKNYTFKPRKPILSWSEKPAIKINGREGAVKVYDYLIEMSVPSKDVVWSYKSYTLRKHGIKAKDTLGRVVFSDYDRSKYKRPLATITVTSKSSLEQHMFLFVTRVRNLLCNIIAKELEVTVYHGAKPFVAKVVKVIE